MIITPRNNFGLADKIKGEVQALDTVRSQGCDMTLPEFMAERGFKDDAGKPFTMPQLFHELGVEPERMTIENMITAPLDVRYLVPEIIREAIRLGLRRAPIHTSIVRSEESVSQPQVVMPKLQFSGNAELNDTAEAQTIGTGYVSYGSKTVAIYKKAKGISISYEAMRYTVVNLINVFFEDLGVRLGHSLDAMAISTIINGDQADGSESAPVIGVESTSTKFAFYDLLRIAIRGGLIGRNYKTLIGGEAMILQLMNLAEFKNKVMGEPLAKLDVKIPIVTMPEVYAHINVPADKLIVQDNNYGLVQLTAQPLMLETERIVQRQLEGTYASIITGFGKLYRDSSLVVDQTKAFSGYGFPDWMITGYTS